MVVLVVERVTPSVRGELTRWMLEVHPGVFVGSLSAMVRERLWELTCRKADKGGCVLAYTANTEQGFVLRLAGKASRALVDFEGLTLVQRPPRNGEAVKQPADVNTAFDEPVSGVSG